MIMVYGRGIKVVLYTLTLSTLHCRYTQNALTVFAGGGGGGATVKKSIATLKFLKSTYTFLDFLKIVLIQS